MYWSILQFVQNPIDDQASLDIYKGKLTRIDLQNVFHMNQTEGRNLKILMYARTLHQCAIQYWVNKFNDSMIF